MDIRLRISKGLYQGCRKEVGFISKSICEECGTRYHAIRRTFNIGEVFNDGILISVSTAAGHGLCWGCLKNALISKIADLRDDPRTFARKAAHGESQEIVHSQAEGGGHVTKSG